MGGIFSPFTEQNLGVLPTKCYRNANPDISLGIRIESYKSLQ